jgi:N-acetyl-anhydromuramyl-L-alanine amidase AmpD
METSMRAQGYGAIADEIFKYRLERETVSAHLRIMHERLSDVMQAFEWLESNDSSPDSFEKTLQKFWNGGTK